MLKILMALICLVRQCMMGKRRISCYKLMETTHILKGTVSGFIDSLIATCI